MSEFNHTGDGDIIITDDSGTSRYPLDWWLTQEPLYTLPEGYRARIYIPNKRHFIFDGVSQHQGQLDDVSAHVWNDGQTYISKRATYDAAWTAYNTPSYTDAEKLDMKIAEIKQEAEERIMIGTDVPGIAGKFKCDNGSVTRLSGLMERARLRESQSLPVNVTFTTAAGTVVNVTSAAQVETVFLAVSGYVEHILTRSSINVQTVKGLTPAEVDEYNVKNDDIWN